MSKEHNPNPALEALKWVLSTAAGVGLSLGVMVTGSLMAEHLKRRMDRGLVHWPWGKRAPIWLGVPPPGALQPKPPAAEYTTNESRPAPVPGLDLSGLIDVVRKP